MAWQHWSADGALAKYPLDVLNGDCIEKRREDG